MQRRVENRMQSKAEPSLEAPLIGSSSRIRVGMHQRSDRDAIELTNPSPGDF